MIEEPNSYSTDALERMDKSLPEVEIWVRERSKVFTLKLQDLLEVLRKKFGNESLKDVGSSGENFTGKNMCIVASESLLSGISRLVDINKYVPGLASLTLNPLHQIVRIEARDESDVLLIDPTYKQINPSHSEDVLILRPSQIAEYYPEKVTGQPIPKLIDENHSSWSLRNVPPQEVLDAQKELMLSMKV